MPSFADLKAKAAGVTNSGVEKLQTMRDRNTSVPIAKTNWDPYNVNPPPPPPPPRVQPRARPPLATLPPPPSRTGSSNNPTPPSRSPAPPSRSPAPPQLPSRSSSTSAPPPPPPRGNNAAPPPPPPRSIPSGAPPPPPSRTPAPSFPKPTTATPGPPPIIRTTRPDLQPQKFNTSHQIDNTETKIDWANLSPEDKEVFFAWLDEFFSRYLNMDIGPKKTLGVMPPVRTATRPNTWGRSVAAPSNSVDFVLSHPPASKYGSSALDLVHYFDPSTQWTSAWYASTNTTPLPAPLVNRSDIGYACAWRSYGSTQTTEIGVLFSDLSVFWGSVEFNMNRPEDRQSTKRHSTHLPRPKALSKEELVYAHELYGETIAAYAESFLGTGRYCARGECWDLANEALKQFDQYTDIPAPVKSISRTHGHLIFEGKASNKGKDMVGRWRGGDNCVRRGDIVEWRTVRISSFEKMRGATYTLGEPDHTAVIVADTVPKLAGGVSDGRTIKPSELGTLVVVEQSVGQPPAKMDYDLRGMEEGEMWIYRPVGYEMYMGITGLTAQAPTHLN